MNNFIVSECAKNKNDEFYTPEYAITPLLKYLCKPTTKKSVTIWCPFDTEESLYVKIFKEQNYCVIATHISKGEDFFKIKLPECDYIISNPPYSLKGEVLEKLFAMGKPFAMLVGVVGLFESQKRFNIFKTNSFELMYFNRRIAYFRSYEEQTPSLNPPFSSVYVCQSILPQQIVFEEINKNHMSV